MWDDYTKHWSGCSVLELKGHPIALVYWRELYRYGPALQWQGTKGPWTNWRDVVSYYRQVSPDVFWSTFSIGDRRLSFTAIVERLRQMRKEENLRIVARAHAEYTGDIFYEQFSY
ncbi:hypothetical protein BV22DRAFT_1018834 [Leucogyrophana mollusca]|uniref:Uncharacterized protein n=1 Tax=Leucogyrophana mollusca TaxID=85980 RepID=A0ACB8B820_9AGAM|nr:hypothetical protein BV22DRAFT_1018834 [Leucogyrophana mollusca]